MLGLQDKVRIFGKPIPRYFWFVFSGAICDVIQALLDFILYKIYVFEFERDTVCWTLSYALSIFVRHYSHSMLVFGDYDGTYWSSLGKTYLTYSSSIVISMLANHILINVVKLQHLHAWFFTMICIGLYNYFMLRSNWKKKDDDNEKSMEMQSLV